MSVTSLKERLAARRRPLPLDNPESTPPRDPDGNGYWRGFHHELGGNSPWPSGWRKEAWRQAWARGLHDGIRGLPYGTNLMTSDAGMARLRMKARHRFTPPYYD